MTEDEKSTIKEIKRKAKTGTLTPTGYGFLGRKQNPQSRVKAMRVLGKMQFKTNKQDKDSQ